MTKNIAYMPKIIRQNSQGGTLRWDKDDWYAGIKDWANSSFGHDGFGIQSATAGVNPFRTPGLLSPGYGQGTVYTNGSGITITSHAQMGTYTYAFGSSNTIQQIDGFNISVSTTSPYPYTLPSSPSAQYDVVRYNQGGTDYIFFTYDNNPGSPEGEMGRIAAGSPDTIDPDYLSTVPTGAFQLGNVGSRKALEVVGDTLYIGEGNVVHQLRNTAATQNVLPLPTGHKIINMTHTSDQSLVILTQSNNTTNGVTSSSIFIWDRYKDRWDYDYTLNGVKIFAVFPYLGTFGCVANPSSFISTSMPYSNVMIWNGTSLKKMFSIPITSLEPYDIISIGEEVYIKGYVFGSPNNAIPPALHRPFTGRVAQVGANISKFVYSEGLYTPSGYSNGLIIMEPVNIPSPQEHEPSISSVSVGIGRWATQNSTVGVAINRPISGSGEYVFEQTFTDTSRTAYTFYTDVDGKQLSARRGSSWGIIVSFTPLSGGDVPLLTYVDLNYTFRKY